MKKALDFLNFLYDNNISCDTCIFNTNNTPIKNTCDFACGNELNHQHGSYSGNPLWVKRDRPTQVCDLWEIFIEKVKK